MEINHRYPPSAVPFVFFISFSLTHTHFNSETLLVIVPLGCATRDGEREREILPWLDRPRTEARAIAFLVCPLPLRTAPDLTFGTVLLSPRFSLFAFLFFSFRRRKSLNHTHLQINPLTLHCCQPCRLLRPPSIQSLVLLVSVVQEPPDSSSS